MLVARLQFWTCTKLSNKYTEHQQTSIHVTDKTDMVRWVPDDQRITIYDIYYSSVPSIHYSVTEALTRDRVTKLLFINYFVRDTSYFEKDNL